MNKEISKRKIILIITAIFVLLLAAGTAFYFHGISAVSDKDKTEVIVTVKEGSSAYEILYALDDAGLVNNSFCGKIYVKFFAPDMLQANTYILDKTLSLPEMLEIISSGNLHYVQGNRFTIIEGATAKDAAANISEALGIDQESILSVWSDKSFLKELIDEYWFLTDEILVDGLICPLEGYLYPETYFITDPNAPIEKITREVLDMTDEKLSVIKEDIAETGMSVHEFLSIASIVENESYFEEDRAKIAGVFFNRLNEGMLLQSDTTVLYPLGVKRIEISYTDLEVDSPFNTYIHPGLPIGPVSNACLDTMEDTIHHQKHDYFYFFAKEDGTVIYTKTYEEHLEVAEENLWY